MEARALFWVSDGLLSQEKLRKVDIRVKVDIHRQFKSIYCQILKAFSEAASMIVNQNLDGTMLPNDAIPSLGRVLNICKISSVKVNFLETCIACDCFDILEKLGC